VDSPNDGFKNIDESLEHLSWRNNQYINSAQNMKFDNADKKIVLDYGCGPGNGLVNIIMNGKPRKIIAIDVSEKAIKLAKKRMLLHKIDVEFIKINEKERIESIKNDSVDVIKCDGVLHHIDDIDFTLKEFNRIIKKDGCINLMIYNKNSVWNYLHVGYELKIKRGLFTDFSDEEIFRMSTDGFRCPVSRCFTPDEFKKICKRNKFSSKLINISISKFEMSKISLIQEAITCKDLDQGKKDFLKRITLNRNGIPMYNQNVAGINSYFELRKI
tara:strand:- start:517 stop:1332 length:816 start_codon:yes stop_codon:yes gene_type:complete